MTREEVEKKIGTNAIELVSCYGIECDDGWVSLIGELIDKIHGIDPDVKFAQIKEKFGGLRVYINYSTEEVYNLIHEYEDKSYTICEVCGEPGQLCKKKLGQWQKTVCEKHQKEFDYVPIKD